MDATDQLAAKLTDGLKTALGPAWADLSVDDKVLIAECCTDAAALQIDTLAAPADAAAAKVMSDRRADIDAQLANIAAMETAVARTAFWNVVADTMSAGAHVLVKVALAAI
jgi:hypothetical protein